MANNQRSFGLHKADKSQLATCNEKGSLCPNLGVEFELTGNFTVEHGYTNRATKEHIDNGKSYAYFEGKKSGRVALAGISAGVFLRQPYAGWPEGTPFTDFHKKLNDCNGAEELYDLLDANGVFGGRKIFVSAHTRVNEVPYNGKDERPVPYAIFDLK